MELEARSYGASKRDRFNRIFERPESERSAPNAFLVECLGRIASTRERESPDSVAGDALDVAMGDGRNTIALAQHGYRVVGFDMADVGVNRARKRAADLGLTIDARVDTFGDAYFQPDQWDVVALMYFGVDANDLERIKSSVKPGGYLIMERAGGDSGNGTLRSFLDWHIEVYESGWGSRDWASNLPDPGEGIRTHLLARRPSRR